MAKSKFTMDDLLPHQRAWVEGVLRGDEEIVFEGGRQTGRTVAMEVLADELVKRGWTKVVHPNGVTCLMMPDPHRERR